MVDRRPSPPGSKPRYRSLLLLCSLLVCWSVQLAFPAMTVTSAGQRPDDDAVSTGDRFGGVQGRVVDPPGFFRVMRVGSRWIFVTPDGRVFWMRGVFHVDRPDSPDEKPESYASRVLRKYGSPRVWGEQTLRRLKDWGFNTLAEYASTHLFPQNVRPELQLPYVVLDRPSWYGLSNQGGYAPGPFKDLVECQDPSTYTGYRGGSLPDVFDPNFAAYVEGRFRAGRRDPFWRHVHTSPWKIGLATDDTDDLFGFGPGPEIPAPVLHSHPGWYAISASPVALESRKHGVRYRDTKVYTKYALRDFLKAKYSTIRALNAAWRSTYTTWESDGGYGQGAGFLDENGRHAWAGDRDGTLRNAEVAVTADLDDFLYVFAKTYFATVALGAKQVFPDHLVFGPATLNGWGGLSRREVLRAAGEHVDVLQAGLRNQQALDLTVRYAGDVPIVTWEGVVANPDSGLWRFPNPALDYAVATQADRGRRYAARVEFLLSATSFRGTRPVAGLKFWEWTDNWGEKRNWGLVSLRDNAYDGKEAVVASVIDSGGYSAGGESRDFGDLITAVRTSNLSVTRRLGVAPPSR